MQILKDKRRGKTAVIVLVLMMTSIMLFAMVPAQVEGQLQQVGAPTYQAWQTSVPSGIAVKNTIATEAFMSVSPNPIGLNQLLLVNIWLEPPTQYQRFFSGFTVDITKPDGSKETIGPLNSYQGDATEWFTYQANQEGTWKFKFNFAGNYFPNGTYFNGKVYDSVAAIGPYNAGPFSQPTYLDSAFYQPSSSPETSVTVQHDMVASWPAASLPTDYWARPIPIGNREWWSIGGQFPFVGQGGGPDWPANTNAYASNYKFTPYVQGPNSAHVVWLREGALAGIMGGQYGINSVGPGESTYAGTPNIIFQGRAYQTVNKPATVVINGSSVVQTISVWQCYDIRTGQIYWEQTGITQPPTVVMQNLVAGAVPGAEQTGMGAGSFSLAYVSGNRYIRYDPYTGSVQLNITLPFASSVFYCDPYILSIQNMPGGKYNLVNWTTLGASMSGGATYLNIMNNISYPVGTIGTTDYESMVSVYTGSITPTGAGTAQGQWIAGISLITGAINFNVTTSDIFYSTSTGVADHGKYAVRVLGGWWDCWSLTNGNLVWKTPAAGTPGGEPYPWGDFGAYTTASYGGLIYDFSYAGFYAIDWSTGKISWGFVPPATPFEAPWYPSMSLFSNSPIIADGKLYYANGEHSPSEPLSRGWTLWCLNATSGQVIWSKLDGGSAGAIADGYLTFDDRYDGYLYVFGKGPSATTVSVPQIQIPTGTSVVVSGTVLDQSPGMVPASTSPSGITQTMKNSRGIQNVAAVSDETVSTYMSYLYGQQPLDGMYHNITVTGVPVSIDAIDPNGNAVHLGDTTSDSSGTYAFRWTPDKPGNYQITASFQGSNSYGSSWAETHAVVVNAPTVSASPTTTSNSGFATASDLMTYIAVAVIAMIIAVAIATVLILRKH